MGEFFSGWKRKVGCITLMMTCGLVLGWVRSFGLTDVITADFSAQSSVFVESSSQTIGAGMERVNPRTMATWNIFPVWNTTQSSGIKPLDEVQHVKWNTQWHGFGVGGNYEYYPNNLLFEVQIPYWFIVLPLTTLSAFLLLTKPHPSIDPKQNYRSHRKRGRRGGIVKGFFWGWRRKVGAVTLMLALVAMGGWVRSLTVHDVVIIGTRTNTCSVTSMAHCLIGMALTTKDGKREKTIFIRRSGLISEGKMLPPSTDDLSDGQWKVAVGEFYIKGANGMMGFPSDLVPKPSQEGIPFSIVIAQLPYWSVVLPLTLLSAFLLLTKPKTSTQKKTTGAIADEGA